MTIFSSLALRRQDILSNWRLFLSFDRSRRSQKDPNKTIDNKDKGVVLIFDHFRLYKKQKMFIKPMIKEKVQVYLVEITQYNYHNIKI